MQIRDLSAEVHHPVMTEIVDTLCNMTRNKDRSFFSAEVCYYLGVVASNMRATIATRDRGDIPVNIYSIALATSGFGKGHSVHILEENVFNGFRRRFMQDTFNVLSDMNLWKVANQRALANVSDPQVEYDDARNEWRAAGSMRFTFDSATPPAIKQLRTKMMLSDCGGLAYQVDEIGSNFVASIDVLTLFLELYDQGKVKEKLIKNTAENLRGEELDGKTPTNMMLFGTPAKLFDGSTVEDQFYSFLEIGYARRCIFGFGEESDLSEELSAAEIYAQLVKPENAEALLKWRTHFQNLADPAYHNWRMTLPDDVAIELLDYRLDCERAARKLPEHDAIRKAEIAHRYFRVLKLAGAYAFVDTSTEITMAHLMSAMKLVEESGVAFHTILTREKSYTKLAKYIASVGVEVTHADLLEALPFYKSGVGPRTEQMTLATAWGYKNNIIIKKNFVDGIEFFRGESLQETNVEEMIVSYSPHWAYNYLNEKVPFTALPSLVQAEGYNWTNHHFIGGAEGKGHREKANVIPGFNCVVLDIDKGTSLGAAQELMRDHMYMTYTTKRHTDENHRFRMILPTSHVLELDDKEYKEFCASLISWLPFKIDEEAMQRERKWLSHKGGQIHINREGDLLDVLNFIPKTSRNEQHMSQVQTLGSMDNLERWFAPRMAEGSRNNHMLRFAMVLADSGLDLTTIHQHVMAFNAKLSNPLDEGEIDRTVMTTVAKRLASKA